MTEEVLPKYRIIVLGADNSGKTNLMTRYTSDIFDEMMRQLQWLMFLIQKILY